MLGDLIFLLLLLLLVLIKLVVGIERTACSTRCGQSGMVIKSPTDDSLRQGGPFEGASVTQGPGGWVPDPVMVP